MANPTAAPARAKGSRNFRRGQLQDRGCDWTANAGEVGSAGNLYQTRLRRGSSRWGTGPGVIKLPLPACDYFCRVPPARVHSGLFLHHSMGSFNTSLTSSTP